MALASGKSQRRIMRDALYEVKDGPLRIDATCSLPILVQHRDWEIVDLDHGGPDSAGVPMNEDSDQWYYDDDATTVVPLRESVGPSMEQFRLGRPHSI